MSEAGEGPKNTEIPRISRRRFLLHQKGGAARAEKPVETRQEKAGGFLTRPISRRNLLILAATTGGASVGLGLLRDFLDATKDQDEYGVPEKATKALAFLEEANIALPQDELYGFTFPSTKEMALKYRAALNKPIGDPTSSSLIMFQQTEPRTLTRLARRIFGFEKFSSEIESKIDQAHVGGQVVHILPLPSWTLDETIPWFAVLMYHEGMHFFYQDEGGPKNSQEWFQRELEANIGDVILKRLLRASGDVITQTSTDETYADAISQRDKTIFEKELNRLYSNFKLP